MSDQHPVKSVSDAEKCLRVLLRCQTMLDKYSMTYIDLKANCDLF